MDILEKIRDRSVTVGMIGLGYVGLPFAVEFAQAGVRVLGIDVDREKVERVRRGESYIPDVPSAALQAVVRAGHLTAHADYAHLREADAAFICVPTPFTRAKAPDISYVEAAARALAGVLHRDMLVVLQSTTYPGTTEEVVQPILEQSGLKGGRDFSLAFSPERIDPGNKLFGARNTPKVVGGVTPADSERVAALFSLIIDPKHIHVVSGPRAAEMCKLLENTFRSVNIALVNELAKLCDRMGLDIWEVIEAAATKPFGFMPFFPGVGVGGHCIPVDPYYLSWKAREYNFYTKFIELAAEVNQSMPYYTLHRLARALNERGKPLKGARILVLGAAFKRDIDDCRNSPAVEVLNILAQSGAAVCYNDPHVPKLAPGEHGLPAGLPALESRPLTPELLAAMDCVLIAVRHSTYDVPWILRHSRLVFDAQNATRGLKEGREKVVRL